MYWPYEEWDSQPGDLGTGQVSGLNEKRMKPRKRKFPFGFTAEHAQQRYAPARNRHHNTVARRTK